jgi:hypothetical protein
MPAKKSSSKKTTSPKVKSAMNKIAETIGTVAGEIAVKKDQITDMASNAIEAVKSKIHEATAPEIKKSNTAVKKVSKKANSSNTIKMARGKADKKTVAPAKKTVTAKSPMKKAVQANKKASPANKPAVKQAKKAVKK